MATGKTGFLRALDFAFDLAARRTDATKTLEDVAKKALEVAGGEQAFLVVSKRGDPFAIHTAIDASGRTLAANERIVSTTVLQNAWDMRDTVVTKEPFDVLVGSRGEYELKTSTYDDGPALRSVIVCPLEFEKRMIGALVLHERTRAAPFSIHDRLALEPLAQLAAKVLADSATKLAADMGTHVPTPPRSPAKQDGIVGSSETLRELLDRVDSVAAIESNVLIVGETGTGKELIAHRIHAKSPRAKGKLVIVNMAQLGPELIEAELFGHVKGSFTGAMTNRIGLFEEADGGTIFLDEVGELSLVLQGRLLRAIQQKTIRSVGSTTEKRLSVRVIAATNRDLLELSSEGGFKHDVYMRLAGVRIDVPPLRERREDIPELVNYIIDYLVAHDGCRKKSFTQAAVKKLMRYDWPGNVRELENVLREALVFTKSSIVDAPDVKIREKVVRQASGAVLTTDIENYLKACDALRETSSMKAAYEKLGVSRATLNRYFTRGKDFDPSGKLLPDALGDLTLD